MTEAIRFADWSSRAQLAALWQACFPESRADIDLFLGQRFRPENTLVYYRDGQIAAMVHMLPAHIRTTQGLAQAHYIYAAATAPAWRNRGLMAELMAHSAAEGAERGDQYACLLPAEPSLYEFYARHGFSTYFQTAFAEFAPHDLQRKVGSNRSATPLDREAVTPFLQTARDLHVARALGSVVWDSPAIDYAARYLALFGGKLVTISGADGFSYALCSGVYDGVLEVHEFAASERDEAALCAEVLQSTQADRYRFRLPQGRSLFGQVAAATDFGMIKSLTPLAADNHFREPSSAPYLGLTLD